MFYVRNLAYLKVIKIVFYIFFRHFVDLAFMFKFMIHFGLLFMGVTKKWLRFIFIQMATVPPNYLMKKKPFSN